MLLHGKYKHMYETSTSCWALERLRQMIQRPRCNVLHTVILTEVEGLPDMANGPLANGHVLHQEPKWSSPKCEQFALSIKNVLCSLPCETVRLSSK
jgi:hypothetical protein